MNGDVYFVCRCGQTRILAPANTLIQETCPECGPVFACSATAWDQVEATVRWMCQALTEVGAYPIPCVTCGRSPIEIFVPHKAEPVRYVEAHWQSCPLESYRLAPGLDGHPS